MAEPLSETGRSIAHYTIEKILGRGSVGVVYLARDRRIGRRVALKHVEVDSHRFEDERDEADFFMRLQREVEVCGRLNHVNLVTLYDVGYEKERVSYLAMELVDGPSLLDVIKSRRPEPLPLAQAIDIAMQILRGLAYAHGRGIVHRDIKPANVLLTSEGQAKIADFGIARPDDSSMTATGTLVGTPNYMSPEQVQGHTTTQRSDLFSFGAVLYEMLTGRKPFAATDVSGVLYKVVAQPHPAIVAEDVPPRLARLVDGLLEKSPEARPVSADEALAELGAIEAELRGEGVPASNREDAATSREPDAEAGSAVGREPASEAAAVEDRAPAPDQAASLDDATVSSGLTTIRRVIPARVFWGVTGGLAVLLGAVVVSIAIRIDDSPTVTIPPETLAEFAAKREALDAAGELCSAGRLDDCVAAYDAYLERYPGSAAALARRDEAVRLNAKERMGEIVEIEAKRGVETAAETDEPSGWQKFKKGVRRVFGRD
jgi:hypothetical protein